MKSLPFLMAAVTAQASGCPGRFSFAPQDMRTYHDNIVVTAN